MVRLIKSETGRGRLIAVTCVALVVVAIGIYLTIGARAANTWAHPRRNTYFSTTPASFNLEFRDVRFPSRDPGIEISGWWIPRAGSGKAIVMVHGRGENRTSSMTISTILGPRSTLFRDAASMS